MNSLSKIIGGIIELLFGIGLSVYGYDRINSYRIFIEDERVFSTILIFLGFALIISGVISISFGVYENSKSTQNNLPYYPPNDNPYDNPNDPYNYCCHNHYPNQTNTYTPPYPPNVNQTKKKYDPNRIVFKECPQCHYRNPIVNKVCFQCHTNIENVKPACNEYNTWVCPECYAINQNYVGTCGCGQRKPN